VQRSPEDWLDGAAFVSDEIYLDLREESGLASEDASKSLDADRNRYSCAGV
jgi:hypothetical protein